MKVLALLLLFVLAIVLAPCAAVPIEDNVKCHNNCDVVDMQPICGTDDEGHTRTFSNFCILKIENCLRDTNFQKTADGACP